MKSSIEQLRQLAPLAGLSAERLTELAEIAHVEHVARGTDPLAGRPATQSVFLLSGEMLLFFQGGGTLVVVGGTEETKHALNRQKQKVARSRAISEVDLLTLEDELLDILATWDQVAAGAEGAAPIGGALLGFRGGFQRLAERLANLHPMEGETLVKLLTGDLQLGIDRALVEEAVAAAFKTEAPKVRQASALTGDPGVTAVLARHQRLAEATAPIADSPASTGVPDTLATKELPFPQESL